MLSSVILNQNTIHEEFGGVFPEFASRAHVQNIIPTIKQAIDEAGITLDDIRAIGVTRGPGLMGSLLVGINTAKALAMGWEKPIIGVNHLRGHIRSAELEGHQVQYPAMILLASGGHTILAFMPDRNTIELLGETRDDSVGEAFDKVGRMLNLGFPAGPIVDKLAYQGEPIVPLPRPLLHEGLEFSFSGLKSSVARYLAANPDCKVEDVCASFVEVSSQSSKRI